MIPKECVKVAVIYLYGCNMDSPLKMHLDKAILTILDENIKHIILSGGPTQQKRFPGKTEADVAYEYIKGFAPSDCYIYRENNSFTTYDNTKYSARTVYGLISSKYYVSEIIIFCEALRTLKIATLARHFFPDFHPGKPERKLRFETASWEQMNPTLELVATIKDFLALYIPGLASFFRWQRIKAARNK